MHILWQELTAGLGDPEHVVRVAFRLIVAMLLGAVVGYDRERVGQWAGLRTHMLVSLGSALLVVIPAEAGLDDSTRVIQGIATGIGFIGASSVLKLAEAREIRGVTTAAGIWVTAAVGVAAGLGFVGVAALAVLLAWVVLTVMMRVERRFGHQSAARRGAGPGAAAQEEEGGNPSAEGGTGAV